MSLTISIDSAMYSPPCNGGAGGGISIGISGGTPPYSAQWKKNGVPFSTSKDLVNLYAAFYQVVVTDSVGATATTSMTLGQPTAINPHATVTPATCNSGSGSRGTLSVSPSGGTSPYFISWSTGQTVVNNIGVFPGSYSVTISDANGCSVTTPLVMPVTPKELLEIQQTPSGDGVVLTAIYNCSSGSIVWSTGATTTTIDAEKGETYVLTLTCPHGEIGNCTQTLILYIPTDEDKYWCCAAEKLGDEVQDLFDGVKECECGESLILMNLIGVYNRFSNGSDCLTDVQKQAVIGKLNSMCGCNCN